jgi:hypothetical protein
LPLCQTQSLTLSEEGKNDVDTTELAVIVLVHDLQAVMFFEMFLVSSLSYI